jgi:hypothetical protein
MQPSDPFPIERCSPRLKTAVLAEFNGRSPTYQDILSIPLEQWLTVPGMGRRLLSELESLIQSQPSVPQVDPSPETNDSDLIARLERFQRDLRRLQHDIQVLLDKAPSRKADANRSDLHESPGDQV